MVICVYCGNVSWSRCAYALVCELDENCMQAEAILTAIAMLIAEHITSHEQKNAEVQLLLTGSQSLLHHFMPIL